VQVNPQILRFPTGSSLRADLLYSILNTVFGLTPQTLKRYPGSASLEDDLIYNLLYQLVNNGATGGGASGWLLTGNAPVPGNFLGTTTDSNLEIRTGNPGFTRMIIGNQQGMGINETLVQISEEFGTLSFGNKIPTFSPCNICSNEELGITSIGGLNFVSKESATINAVTEILLFSTNIKAQATGDLLLFGNSIVLSTSNIPGNTGVYIIGAKSDISANLSFLGIDPGSGEVKTVSDAPFVASGTAWLNTGNNGTDPQTPMIFGTNTTDDVILRTAGTDVGVITKTGSLGIGTVSPNATFQVNGSFSTGITRIDDTTHPTGGTYEIGNNQYMTYIIEYSGDNDLFLHLPPTTGLDGKLFVFKRMDGGGGGQVRLYSDFSGDAFEYENGSYTNAYNIYPMKTLMYQVSGNRFYLISAM
jgi:hypothetical protein